MDLSETQKYHIAKIAQKYSLELILLFGSRIRNKKFLHRESDFDVAYLSKRNLDLMEEAKLICDLMPIFKSDKVDLVNLKRSDPLLMKQVFDNHKVLFCQNPKIYLLYQIYAMKRFIEAKPLFDLTEESIKHFIKQHGG